MAYKCSKSTVVHYHVKVQSLSLRRNRKLRLRKIWSALFPDSHSADGTHCRVFLDEAIKCRWRDSSYDSRGEVEVNRTLTRLPIGTSKVWATNQMVWHALTGVADKLWSQLERKYNLCHLPDLEAARAFKAVENVCRRTNRWLDGSQMEMVELGHIIGVSLMTGRARHIANWEEERKNRCSPSSVIEYVHPLTKDNADGLQALHDELLKIMFPMVNAKRIDEVSWGDYIRTAQTWLTAGSVGGAKITYSGSNDDNPLPRGSLNKRVLMEHIPLSKFADWLTEQKPEVIASASEKWENGKGRAIYGTMLTDYLIFGYVLSLTEPMMAQIDGCETGASGYGDVRNVLCRLYTVMQEEVECAMGDYMDFNRQHMLAVLSLRYRVLKELCRTKGVSNPDVFAAIDWCAEALVNCYAYFPEGENSKKTYRSLVKGTSPTGLAYEVSVPSADGAAKVYQGMFSGHRGTSSDNTILNIAYMNVAAKYVKDAYDLEPENVHRVHTGDDIWVTNTNTLWGAAVYDTMISQGLQLQPVKQLFSRRGEFLRVLYTREGLQGYLCRAIAAWVTSPLQSKSGKDIVERLSEIRSTVQTCYRRGAAHEPLSALQSLVSHRANKLKWMTNTNRECNSSIPWQSLAKGYVVGGIDYGPPGTFGGDWDMIGDLPRYVDPRPPRLSELPHKMAQEQAQYDRSRLTISNASTGLLQEAYHEQNFSGCADSALEAEALSTYGRALDIWRTKVEGRRNSSRRNSRLLVYPACDRQQYAQYWVTHVHSGHYDYTWRKYIPTRDDWEASPPPTPLCCIDKAIRLSGFKDITTVERLFYGNKIDLVLRAIDNCRVESVRMDAMSALSNLRRVLIDRDVARIVCGMRVDGPSLAWLLPDNVLSYTSNVIVTAVMDYSAKRRRFTLASWGREVSRASRECLSYLAKHTDWLLLGRS